MRPTRPRQPGRPPAPGAVTGTGGGAGADASARDLRTRLPALMLRDEQRLRRRLDGARGIRDATARRTVLTEIGTAVDAAERRIDRRRSSVPRLRYPPDLPVSQRKDEILAAIRDHQVVVLAGETGSGKTTQLPTICLELGRGIRGRIGHTQPRRIAARAVADRIAEELGTCVGDVVGYQVRFTDQVGDGTLVKLMTDGILLAEIQGDRLLRQYDTLIIDEAHERSLTIDFILGYLSQLLPRRPDLKVVITSATIDPERFSRHFGGAPVVEVSGRTYPVEVRYRPVVDPDDSPRERPGRTADRPVARPAADPDRDQVQAILDAVDELGAEGPGDVLVFLSGEREIRDTAEALRRHLPGQGTEVLPLYARLSTAEQHRVFQPHGGRRIVLATNVAETSLTVPGIRYVVDPGTARMSRYSQRLKVQRLPIERVSRASADQRKGRCGRTADGVCIRLYSEEDFHARPDFTEPEILRTSLAAVILQMAALGLGEVEDFPFVDPPDRRQVRAGVQLLEELSALDLAAGEPTQRLTPLGRRLAQLPLDPRLARMVLEAEHHGCVREVMVITAALSIQDPRERPLDHQQAADESHRRFTDADSDFLAYLNLWNYLREQQQALSSSQFRRMCRTEHLHYLRIREWQDVYAQLRQAGRGLGLTPAVAPAAPDLVHRSLLAGLLSHVGLLDTSTRDYLGARGARFAIFPASALFRKPPRWVMAAELVETSRLWARTCARIEPEWVEPLAQHLVRRTYSEPRWDRDRGSVVASERVTLYGVPIVAGRTVPYGRIEPELSRELFIRHALVEGDWSTHHRFFHRNRELLAEAEELENRARRRGIVADDEALFEFYDRRIGAEVVSGRHFDSWWQKVRRTHPDVLTFSSDMLVDGSHQVAEADYPDTWEHDGLRLRLSYRFEPGTDSDGVTVHVPLAVLNRVGPEGFDWQVPGLREELVTELIRSLPKAVRRSFVPAPDHARAVLARIGPDVRPEPLVVALERELARATGVVMPRGAWDLARVPSHLRMTFRVVDPRGHMLAEGKDVDEIKQRLAGHVRAAMSDVAADSERTGLRAWDFGTLPTTYEQVRDGHRMLGFPALVDKGDTVAVRILATPAEQRGAMQAGTRRLLLLTLPSPLKTVVGRLDTATKLALSHSPYGGVPALLEDCVACAVDALVTHAGGPAWDEDGFERLRDVVRAGLPDTVADIVSVVARILSEAHEVDSRLFGTTSPVLQPALTDLRRQLEELVHRGFVSTTGRTRLPDLVRYLRAMQRRLDTLPTGVVRDRERMAMVERVRASYENALAGLAPGRPVPDQLRQVRWMIEELRVSLFAQTLGTPFPVSEKRISKALAAMPARPQVAT